MKKCIVLIVGLVLLSTGCTFIGTIFSEYPEWMHGTWRGECLSTNHCLESDRFLIIEITKHYIYKNEYRVDAGNQNDFSKLSESGKMETSTNRECITINGSPMLENTLFYLFKRNHDTEIEYYSDYRPYYELDLVSEEAPIHAVLTRVK